MIVKISGGRAGVELFGVSSVTRCDRISRARPGCNVGSRSESASVARGRKSEPGHYSIGKLFKLNSTMKRAESLSSDRSDPAQAGPSRTVKPCRQCLSGTYVGLFRLSSSIEFDDLDVDHNRIGARAWLGNHSESMDSGSTRAPSPSLRHASRNSAAALSLDSG
jgi:hypothetical protein